MPTVANLGVSLTARTRRFSKRMRGARKNVVRFGRDALNAGKMVAKMGVVAAAGAAAAGAAIFHMANTTTKAGDLIAKTSKRLGISAKGVSALGFAAERSGAAFEDVVKSIRTMARYADEAAQGTKEYQDLFDRLGVSVVNTGGKLKSTEKLFLELADGIANLDNEAEQIALAQQIFGRGGTAILPLLKEGRAGIRDLMIEAERLGVTWNSKTAAAAERFQDRLTDLTSAASGLRRTVVMHLAPDITKAMSRMTEWVLKHRNAVVDKLARGWDIAREKFGAAWDKFTAASQDGRLGKWADGIANGFMRIVAGIQAAIASGRAFFNLVRGLHKWSEIQQQKITFGAGARESKREAALLGVLRKRFESTGTPFGKSTAVWGEAHKAVSGTDLHSSELLKMQDEVERAFERAQRVGSGETRFDIIDAKISSATRSAKGFQKSLADTLNEPNKWLSSFKSNMKEIREALDGAFGEKGPLGKKGPLGTGGKAGRTFSDRLGIAGGRGELVDPSDPAKGWKPATGAGILSTFAAKPKPVTEQRFAGAAEMGSREAYSAVIRHRGGGGDKAAETARNTGRTAKGVESLRGALERIAQNTANAAKIAVGEL